jgi:TetR/AcrR family transcriptional repressor of bet genes
VTRRPNTEHRRSEIVLATMKVVAAKGYEKATIQEIATEAGLTPGLIHYHFSDKREILIALAKHLSDFAYSRYVKFAEAAKTPEERFRAYLEARLGFGKGASSDAVAAWVVVGSEAVRHLEIGQVYQEAITAELKLISELLSAYFAEHRRSQESVAHLAAVLMSFMEGAFQLSRAASQVMPRKYAAESAFQLVERFLRAEPKV